MSGAHAHRSPDAATLRRPRPEHVVQASGLCEPLASLVTRTVRRTRLWRSERVDVARELCAHFLDGLESGQTPEALAQAFGNPASAARLIARGRRRQRPWLARAFRASYLAAAAGLALAVTLYAVLALRLVVARAHIARNFTAELNAASSATPADHKAWPALADARVAMGKLPDFMDGLAANAAMVAGSPDWPKVVGWLDLHRAELAALREAASRPELGFTFGDLDPAYERILIAKGATITPEFRERQREFTQGNPPLFGLLLPYLAEFNWASRLLNADAILAAQRRDGEAFVANIEASLHMARHARTGDFLVSQAVQSAIAHRAYNSVLFATEQAPFLSRPQLRALAHTVAGFAGGFLRMDLAGERIMVEDMLQRAFSDDGEGNGYYLGNLVVDARMTDLWNELPGQEPRIPWSATAMRPVGPLLLPSRQEIRARMDRVNADFAADESLPPWRSAERTSDFAHEQVLESWPSHVARAMQAFRVQGDGRQLGHFARALEARDLAEAHRAAALVALACLAFQADRGAWPTALAEIVPAYLPAIPADPFSGAPLCYRVQDGAPILYSVASDRVDDGGLEPLDEHGQALSRRLPEPGQGGSSVPPAAHGDWRLWQGARNAGPRS